MKTLVLLLLSVCAVYGGNCPDGSSCSDSETCCATSFGGYGCCPMASAVCCTDGQHCCPANTQCDLEHQKCVSQTLIPFLEKREPFQFKKIQASAMMEANKIENKNLFAAEHRSSLIARHRRITPVIPPPLSPPNKSSSVLMRTARNSNVYCPGGAFYCPDGSTCCNDGRHCCPYGTRCADTSQYCIPMLGKRRAQLVK